MAGDLLDRAQIDPRLDLLAAHRARQQQAEEAGVVQLAEQRLGKVLRALDLVDHGRDRRPQRARPREGIGLLESCDTDVVHGASALAAGNWTRRRERLSMEPRWLC